MGWGWNKDIYLRGMVNGYIMERDRILRRRRENEKKKDIEETIRNGVKIEIEKIRRNKVNAESQDNYWYKSLYLYLMLLSNSGASVEWLLVVHYAGLRLTKPVSEPVAPAASLCQ